MSRSMRVKPNRLIFLPLERNAERYTEWTSGEGGAIECDLIDLQIPFVTLRPHNLLVNIKNGRVLDAGSRARWAFQQTSMLMDMILDGQVSNTDAVYMEDFWHPGMEMIPYMLSTKFGPNKNKWPRIYAFNCAQSVDPYDFTASWIDWIRPFENAWANVLSGIFVSCPEHKDLCIGVSGLPHGIDLAPNEEMVHAVGLTFRSDVVKRLAVLPFEEQERENRVVFSSRWDKEKNPDFFIKLVNAVLKERTDIKFVVCSGFNQLVSNDPALLKLAKATHEKHPFNFKVMDHIPKSIYYRMLQTSKVQFNCASQDWVSNTLNEAATFGCAPLYPEYLSFPAALEFREKHLYAPNSIESAKRKLYRLIDSHKKDEDFSWVYKKYDDSFKRMLKIMGFKVGKLLPLNFNRETK